jgi:hypothetical protein
MKTSKTVLLILLAMLGGSLHAQVDSRAIIREITGTVELKAPGAERWSPARAGQEISRATVISTGFKSIAIVALGNSTVTVRPLTRLTLEEIQSSQGDESVRLELHAGRVRAEVNPPSGGRTDFTVRSPQATASVRGTAFDFDGMNLDVAEGRVYVAGGDGTGNYIGAGHRSLSSSQTGRTTGSGELERAGLSPLIPVAAAVAGGGGSTTPNMTRAVDFSMDIGFK